MLLQVGLLALAAYLPFLTLLAYAVLFWLLVRLLINLNTYVVLKTEQARRRLDDNDAPTGY